MSGKLTKKEEEKIKKFISDLKEEDMSVYAIAIYALGFIGEKAIPALKESLNDEDEGVRIEAALALGYMGEKAAKALPQLKKLLPKEKDTETKFFIAYSLTLIDRKEGIGTKVIKEMKEKGELVDWQIGLYKSLCQELNIEQSISKTTEVIQTITQLSAKQVDSEEKQKLLEQISILEQENKKLDKQLKQYISSEKKPWDLHKKQLINSYQQLERDDLGDEEKIKLKEKIEMISDLGSVLPPRPKTWFERNKTIVVSLISIILSSAVTLTTTLLTIFLTRG